MGRPTLDLARNSISLLELDSAALARAADWEETVQQRTFVTESNTVIFYRAIHCAHQQDFTVAPNWMDRAMAFGSEEERGRYFALLKEALINQELADVSVKKEAAKDCVTAEKSPEAWRCWVRVVSDFPGLKARLLMNLKEKNRAVKIEQDAEQPSNEAANTSEGGTSVISKQKAQPTSRIHVTRFNVEHTPANPGLLTVTDPLHKVDGDPKKDPLNEGAQTIVDVLNARQQAKTNPADIASVLAELVLARYDWESDPSTGTETSTVKEDTTKSGQKDRTKKGSGTKRTRLPKFIETLFPDQAVWCIVETTDSDAGKQDDPLWKRFYEIFDEGRVAAARKTILDLCNNLGFKGKGAKDVYDQMLPGLSDVATLQDIFRRLLVATLVETEMKKMEKMVEGERVHDSKRTSSLEMVPIFAKGREPGGNARAVAVAGAERVMHVIPASDDDTKDKRSKVNPHIQCRNQPFQFFCLSILLFPSIHPSIQFFYLSILLYPSIHPSIHPSIYLLVVLNCRP
jgi:hypothetical protein